MSDLLHTRSLLYVTTVRNLAQIRTHGCSAPIRHLSVRLLLSSECKHKHVNRKSLALHTQQRFDHKLIRASIYICICLPIHHHDWHPSNLRTDSRLQIVSMIRRPRPECVSQLPRAGTLHHGSPISLKSLLTSPPPLFPLPLNFAFPLILLTYSGKGKRYNGYAGGTAIKALSTAWSRILIP